MKNLCLSDVSTKKYAFESKHRFCACYGHYEDSIASELFVCSYNLVVSNYDSCGEIKWTKDLSEFVSPENAPVNITFLGLANCISVGLANGELIVINCLGSHCDLVGTCENGLLAMEWSPDQELLVVVTKNLKVILMSCTFDPINESNLLNDEFGEKQFITVGWGKKETQFHGSEGKQAAHLKTEVFTEKDGESENKIIITWRGDGNLFAVGYLMEGIRRFKVFDRDGNLQYTSEKLTGLEANLAWRPSGNLIATTQKLNDKYVVAFFEKNGLKHGEFTIPIESTTIVEDLFWSFDSEILALLCKETSTNKQKVLLFTSSNYHWYLKQTLHFNEQNLAKIMWDNIFDLTDNKKLHFILQNGQHYAYTWIWNVDHSKGRNEADDAIVAVIDGKKILISAFRYTTVPPPMANTVIELDCDIESIHFAPENDLNLNSNSFVAKTTNNLVFLDQSLRNPLRYEISKTILLEKVSFPFECYNWYWLDDAAFLCASVDGNSSYTLNKYKICDDKIIQVNVQSLPSSVTRITCHPSLKSVVYLQLKSGEILEYSSDHITPQEFSFPEACPKFCVLCTDNDIYFLGLSNKGLLYINDEMVMNNISSIFIHTSYLLITTLKHILLCIELTKSGLNCIKLCHKTETIDIYKRKIERGAKLVVAVPKETRTVLQMPRGNLETIEPRPLSLKIIGEHLNSCKYYDAFDLMRKQRINLNLIYDHNPKLFTENIQTFFDCIQNNSWLNLFLSDLENVDVTKTMYASSYSERNKYTDKVKYGKIHHVCDIVIAHVNKAYDYAYRILPLLTSYVKKNNLEKALDVINKLKKEELGGCDLPISSEEALKYLLYMVNVDNLFDVALGMYDFDLVLLVANKSQKDPKEYIAMLNELNEMDENYKQFTINKHLKRFDKAVKCLVQCGPSRHGELKIFVKYHSLYREALELFTVEDVIHKEISDDFALYLKLKKQYIEAGIVYERARSYDKAIECYKDALEWELAIKLAQDKPIEDLKKLCWDLANALKEVKRYNEALRILEKFDEDNENIIQFAIDCAQFKTALRFCNKLNKMELIGNKLLPSLLEEYINIKDLVETNWNNFNKYRNRLQVVKEIKINKPLDNYDASYGNKDSDLFSDAGSTIASSSSGRSYRSSKNRRKQDRKVASLKEGSQYEDTALILALHTLVTSTYELRWQVKEINIALSCLGKDMEALMLQSSLETTLKEMKDSFQEIWSNEFTLEATHSAITAQNVPEGYSIIPHGMALLEPHLRIAPVIQDVQWKLDGLNL